MSVRVNTNLSVKARNVYTFENFRGVDFSTSPYKVAKTRAIMAENLIYNNGTVRKRNGWTSVCKLDGTINGIFSFVIDNRHFILAYAGKKFYKLDWNEKLIRFNAEDITNSCTYPDAEIDTTVLVSRRVQLYVNKNKAYIVGCGDYLVFGSWDGGENYELRRVYNNEDTFIPTTTINIDNDNVQDENRASLDAVNLLSPKRKNALVGVDDTTATWTLDSPIDEDSNVKVTVNTTRNGEKVAIVLNNYRITRDKTKLYLLDDDLESFGDVDFLNGKITLNINTKPLMEDVSNIVVEFVSTLNGANLIFDGTLSTIFGGGGNSNRLFIGGNSIRKNVHVWSEMYDFTYFADTNFDEIGSDNSSIMGYVRATDGILLVFKEQISGGEATIYYVSGVDGTRTDANGDDEFITKFSKYTGNVSDTIFAKYATASLNGDNLILTRNGVKGLEMFDNTTTNAYRVRERSRNVNAKLLKEDNLEDACAIVHDDKYYLSINGVVYVCDSRFTFHVDEDISDSFNYEWWYWTNVDAHVWADVNGVLMFGTRDGLICQFADNVYADTTYQDTEAGDLSGISANPSNDTIKYNFQLEEELKKGDNITFIQGDLYALYLKANELLSVDQDGWIQIGENTLEKVYEGIELYADYVSGTGLTTNTKYHIGEVDLVDLKFRLFDAENNPVIPTNIGFSLNKLVSNKMLYVADVDPINCEFKIKEYAAGAILDLVRYEGLFPSNLLAVLRFNNNIKASWYTPVSDFGTNMYSKTLFNITVATEPLVKGAVEIGIQTRNIDKFFTTYGTRGFDFNDIDFDDFSFESSFTSSHTIRIKERNFNFMILRYVSDNQQACAVNGISIRYKINRLNKGVR